MNEQVYEVTDDSGFLALVDPKAYVPFVAEDWTLKRLLEHFKTQMSARRLLIWGTGMGNTWRVRVERWQGDVLGFREVSGPIVASGGTLLLTNYEALTMAAQSADVSLPEPHQRNLVIGGLSDEYLCRIIQLSDPDDPDDDGARADPGADFVLKLVKHDDPSGPWSTIPWADV